MTGNEGELVAARAIHALLEAAHAAGVHVDVARFLPPPVSGHDDELVPVDRLFACSRALLSVEREDVGLAIGRRMPLEGTGLWGFLLRSSATFGQMLDRGARYVRIVDTVPEFELRVRGRHAALVSPHPAVSPFGPRHQAVTATMSRWIAWGRQLGGVDFPVVEARVSGPAPIDASPWQRFFGGPVTFGTADDTYLLDVDVLDLPFRESAPELSAELEGLASLLLARLDGAHAFLGRVDRALDGELLGGRPTAEHVARRLAMTPRTLQRRLAEEGWTFRHYRERWLRTRAEHLLDATDASLKEVSFLLGYADPPAFSRAFRRWTGMAPGTWRERRVARVGPPGRSPARRPYPRDAAQRTMNTEMSVCRAR